LRKLADDPRQEGFRLRKMGAADLDAVMAIETVAHPHHWSADLMRRELGHDWSTILLCEEQGEQGAVRLLGFLIFWLVHDELHILNLATAPAERRRGVGRTLLSEALVRARAHRCTLSTLEVRRSNEPAIALYKAYGFRAVGIRPNYYVDEREDAIVMVLDL
jgi:ribosomal-protein-alanine N-acetyltransferase